MAGYVAGIAQQLYVNKYVLKKNDKGDKKTEAIQAVTPQTGGAPGTKITEISADGGKKSFGGINQKDLKDQKTGKGPGKGQSNGRKRKGRK